MPAATSRHLQNKDRRPPLSAFQEDERVLCTATPAMPDPLAYSQVLAPAYSQLSPPTSPNQHRKGKRRASPLSSRLWTACLLACCAFLLLSARGVSASEGDRSAEYQHCVDSRLRDVCGPDGVDDGMTGRPDPLVQPDPQWLPWSLRVTGWNCVDDTKYHCTHKVTNDALRNVQQLRQRVHKQVLDDPESAQLSRAGLREREERLVREELERWPRVRKQMVQYYGKWVFVRVWGAQEPLSVVFSLLNLWVHAIGVFKIRRQVSEAFPLKMVYTAWSLISCNAWLWSSVFHTRDKPWTERFDYFSAASVMLAGLFMAVCRLFRLAPGTPAFVLVLRVMVVAYILHVLYLSFGRFDYGYNMTANVVVGLSHNLLWLLYSLRPQLFNTTLSSNAANTGLARREALRAAKPLSPLLGSSLMQHSATSSSASSSAGSSAGSSVGSSSVPPAPVLMTSAAARGSVGSRESRRRLQLILAGMTLAAMLELLDFPPYWRAVDAHCLWHLSTVPLAHLWYEWLIDDARACVGTGWWIGDGTLDLMDRALARAGATASHARTAVAQSVGEQLRKVDWESHMTTIRHRAAEVAERAGVQLPVSLGSGATSSSSSNGHGSIGEGGPWEREQEKAKELGHRHV